MPLIALRWEAQRRYATSEALRQRTTLYESGTMHTVTTRKISWKQWLSAITRTALGDGFGDLAGKPPADAAKYLGISEQRLSQLIADERLDVIEVITAKGTVAVRLITEASLARYAPQPSGVGFGQTQRTV